MATELETNRKSLHQIDYLQWIETMAERLKVRDYASVDWENLIDEIEDMAKRERRSLDSNLVVVLLHLLKWQYQITARSGSWKGSIAEY
jgi:hypothetical protein